MSVQCIAGAADARADTCPAIIGGPGVRPGAGQGRPLRKSEGFSDVTVHVGCRSSRLPVGEGSGRIEVGEAVAGEGIERDRGCPVEDQFGDELADDRAVCGTVAGPTAGTAHGCFARDCLTLTAARIFDPENGHDVARASVDNRVVRQHPLTSSFSPRCRRASYLWILLNPAKGGFKDLPICVSLSRSPGLLGIREYQAKLTVCPCRHSYLNI